MRGTKTGPSGEPDGDGESDGDGSRSRRLTPSIGLAPASDSPASATQNDATREDFLFHLYRGSELLQDNRAHEAKEELERALQLQPHDAKGQDLLAVVYFRLGLYPRAITIYENLRRTSPRDPALLLNLALCYLKTGEVALARRDLELLLAVNPSHARAWGYLGLACERMGALADAQRAFKHGGHGQMARRMADRQGSQGPHVPQPRPRESRPSREVREAVAAACEELDAGELGFTLAEPASASKPDLSDDAWRAIELGHVAHDDDRSENVAFSSVIESRAPATKNERFAVPPSPGDFEGPATEGRRPTLTVGVPPPPQVAHELEALSRVLSPKPPSFGDDVSGKRARSTAVVVPAPRLPGLSLRTDAAGGYDSFVMASRRTLAPPAHSPTAPPPETVAQPASAPPSAEPRARDSVVAFPPIGRVVIHPSGVALVRTSPTSSFAARLEAMRASSNALTMTLLERRAKGKPTGESFGGVGSPVVHATGEGQLVLAPRPGRTLEAYVLEDDMCFVREDVLLGFDGELAFENGRLAVGDGEFFAVVQLRGKGAVLLEAIGQVVTLEVHGNRGLSVRREVVLGWFGGLVPRALAPSEAPCGQRGLVSFAGEGRVLVASA